MIPHVKLSRGETLVNPGELRLVFVEKSDAGLFRWVLVPVAEVTDARVCLRPEGNELVDLTLLIDVSSQKVRFVLS